MPDAGGNLYFGDLSQQCNWPLNVSPALPISSPPAGASAGNVAHCLAIAEPSPRTAVSEPILHTLVSQSISRHNLRNFDPKIPPPSHVHAHFAQTAVSSAGPPISADGPQTGITSRNFRESRKQKKIAKKCASVKV